MLPTSCWRARMNARWRWRCERRRARPIDPATPHGKRIGVLLWRCGSAELRLVCAKTGPSHAAERDGAILSDSDESPGVCVHLCRCHCCRRAFWTRARIRHTKIGSHPLAKGLTTDGNEEWTPPGQSAGNFRGSTWFRPPDRSRLDAADFCETFASEPRV